MASIPFTLAALATSAVPGLVVFGVRELPDEEDFAAAVVVTEEDELLVRVPRTQAAEVQQSAELLGLAALGEGPRSRLPFAVPRTLGMTRAGETRAVVSSHLDGARFEAGDLSEDALLLDPLATAIAAVHELPVTVAQQGGLPVRTAQDLRLRATRLIDRAAASRLVPETVLQRWERAVETAELWDFAPVMVHGSLDAGQLRVDEDRISAVLGWSELSLGDPAADLSWLLGAGSEVLEVVLSRYARRRNAGRLDHLRTRAALYHELEVARWLLHGTDAHEQDVIDDAVAMLDRMVNVASPLGRALTADVAHIPLGEEQVSALLDETPEVVDHLSDTAAFEALDEDRMFGVDTDFVEPLSEEPAPEGGERTAAGAASGSGGSGESEDAGGPAGSGSPSGGPAGSGSPKGAEAARSGAGAGARDGRDPEPAEHDPSEQLTAPLDDEVLPRSEGR
ncbi:phosphotransferase [Leucobacter massiliensis]|uniref:2'-phosphotransferase n=1 Tax=Leucobacter massiliensis TaxID=1686285 RepID=A0A2S9QMP6_9MICO|nr:phosphotransferase [Leucobacter massiliensis]PRI10869.1 2'-phosphotransferase [Leucobacter massiliensis]